jgi:hypothetical protein
MSLLAVEAVDELFLAQVPGGGAGRIVVGPPVGRAAEIRLMIEADGTILTHWWLRTSEPGHQRAAPARVIKHQ